MRFPSPFHCVTYRRSWFSDVAVVFAACIVFCGGLARAEIGYQSDSGDTVWDQSGGSLQVQAGFNGTWKLGHPVPLRVSGTPLQHARAQVLVAKTVDGDGVPVSYRKLVSEAERKASEIWFSIRVGRRGAPIEVQLLAEKDELLAEGQVSTLSRAEVLDSDQLFVLAVGSSMGIESQVVKNSARTDSNFSVQVLDSADQFPDTWRAYSSCDLLVVSTQDLELIQSMGDRWNALDEWIRRGGTCVLSLASLSQEQLSQVETLSQILPDGINGTGMVTDPGPLESLVAATDDPLDRIPVSILEQTHGEVLLTFKDSLGKQVPWWTHTTHGHGNVHVVASDLGHPSFVDWKERGTLWLLLLESIYDKQVLEGDLNSSGGSDSYLGYKDVVGQLRASLDLFPSLSSLSFGQIAAMLIGIMIVVGPLDYYLSVKLFNRPQLSWYFAGVSLIAICLGLLVLFQAVRPNEIHVNSAQLVDLDIETGNLTGRFWSHVYSGAARRLNLEAEVHDESPLAGEGTSDLILDWQGLPGSGLGGLDSQLTAGTGMPSYEIEYSVDGGQRLAGVPIASAGTKCLTAEWNQQVEIESSFQLKELAGVEQLTGEFTNPFEVDIRDCYIFYHKWFYRLNSRIPAGGRFVIASDMIPKDIARKLNDRKTVAENTSSTRWDPASRSNLDRLLEVMMFYRASTGKNYLGLDHRYQPHMDYSNLLETDTAILVCRLDEPILKLSVVTDEESAPEIVQDVDRVWCRITIPITESVRYSSTR